MMRISNGQTKSANLPSDTRIWKSSGRQMAYEYLNALEEVGDGRGQWSIKYSDTWSEVQALSRIKPGWRESALCTYHCLLMTWVGKKRTIT